MNPYTIALAGNPNTGKSTLFNTLTGLKQHTGNWAGKTVIQASGEFMFNNQKYKIIDLPGTYSLFSNSADEEVARDYIVFEKPDVTVVVLDATALERNLNLALQVLEMTDQVIICVNLIDEARKKGISIDTNKLSKELGVPIVKMAARNGEGIENFLTKVEHLCLGKIKTSPYRLSYDSELEKKISTIDSQLMDILGPQFPTRWIAIRMLDGDTKLFDSLVKRLNDRGESNHESNSKSRSFSKNHSC